MTNSEVEDSIESWQTEWQRNHITARDPTDLEVMEAITAAAGHLAVLLFSVPFVRLKYETNLEALTLVALCL